MNSYKTHPLALTTSASPLAPKVRRPLGPRTRTSLVFLYMRPANSDYINNNINTRRAAIYLFQCKHNFIKDASEKFIQMSIPVEKKIVRRSTELKE